MQRVSAVNCNNNNPLGTNEIHVIPAEQGADPGGNDPGPNSFLPTVQNPGETIETTPRMRTSTISINTFLRLW